MKKKIIGISLLAVFLSLNSVFAREPYHPLYDGDFNKGEYIFNDYSDIIGEDGRDQFKEEILNRNDFTDNRKRTIITKSRLIQNGPAGAATYNYINQFMIDNLYYDLGNPLPDQDYLEQHNVIVTQRSDGTYDVDFSNSDFFAAEGRSYHTDGYGKLIGGFSSNDSASQFYSQFCSLVMKFGFNYKNLPLDVQASVASDIERVQIRFSSYGPYRVHQELNTLLANSTTGETQQAFIDSREYFKQFEASINKRDEKELEKMRDDIQQQNEGENETMPPTPSDNSYTLEKLMNKDFPYEESYDRRNFIESMSDEEFINAFGREKFDDAGEGFPELPYYVKDYTYTPFFISEFREYAIKDEEQRSMQMSDGQFKDSELELSKDIIRMTMEADEADIVAFRYVGPPGPQLPYPSLKDLHKVVETDNGYNITVEDFDFKVDKVGNLLDEYVTEENMRSLDIQYAALISKFVINYRELPIRAQGQYEYLFQKLTSPGAHRYWTTMGDSEYIAKLHKHLNLHLIYYDRENEDLYQKSIKQQNKIIAQDFDFRSDKVGQDDDKNSNIYKQPNKDKRDLSLIIVLSVLAASIIGLITVLLKRKDSPKVDYNTHSSSTSNTVNNNDAYSTRETEVTMPSKNSNESRRYSLSEELDEKQGLNEAKRRYKKDNYSYTHPEVDKANNDAITIKDIVDTKGNPSDTSEITRKAKKKRPK